MHLFNAFDHCIWKSWFLPKKLLCKYCLLSVFHFFFVSFSFCINVYKMQHLFVNFLFMVMQLHWLLIRKMLAPENALIRHMLQLRSIARPSTQVVPIRTNYSAYLFDTFRMKYGVSVTHTFSTVPASNLFKHWMMWAWSNQGVPSSFTEWNK